MIIYDLVCDHAHRFEGWFKSAQDYHQQLADSLLSCPVCATPGVRKVPTASYVQTGKSTKRSLEPLGQGASPSGAMASINPDVLQKIKDYVERSTEDVGTGFAEEAKKMHYGETTVRGIRGKAKLDELLELHEDGIDVLPLPAAMVPNKKLN